MIELELLGLEPSGTSLSLNDADGNRYSLPITDELRAALRKDVTVQDGEPKPITPREIQAYFRAGKTVEEVSEISAMPPSTLDKLADPIFKERQYTATLARSYRQTREIGGMTLEELVASRLAERNIDPESITWDAFREAGAPWTLSATYPRSNVTQVALWRINPKSQTVVALNDEATWLTETQIPAPSTPWRALNTPKVAASNVTSLADAKKTDVTPEPPVEPQPAAEPTPEAPKADAPRAVDIDSMLADLDSQRGTSKPMPTFEDEPESDEADVETLDQEEADAQDDQDSKSEPAEKEASSAPVLRAIPNEPDTPDQPSLPGIEGEADESKPQDKKKSRRRRERPVMPSWDEIVFGYDKNKD